jgi:DEAD/DEAH box helicase
MAERMNFEGIRSLLKSPEAIRDQAFSILHSMSCLSAIPEEAERAHELVLRALEHSDKFGRAQPVLAALARSAGLFPYLREETLNLKDSLAYEFHRPLNMRDDFVFHRKQAEVFRRLLDGESIVLSAPTSFGKSRIIDAVIASDKFDTIVIIVPTLALIDETRRRLCSFSDQYKIVAHLTQKPAERTIFIFTAERAVSYEDFGRVQFFVIDEFYKIGALSEDSGRTVALNQAFYKLRKHNAQFYLLGPSVQNIPKGIEEAYRCTFYATKYATVVSDQVRVKNDGKKDDLECLTKLCATLKEPTLVFCKSPARVNLVARALIAVSSGASGALKPAADWIARNYHPDWVLPTSLEHGVGIHHGKLPRSLAQYIVRMFNSLNLRFLVCTSTLIEGVNTKAKNVIVFDNQIARKNIDFFTFNNIRGRSGRMFEHFVGNVYLFHEPPTEELPFVDFPVFSQTNTVPTSLLLQMDGIDLSQTSGERLRQFREQKLLPVETLQANSSIAPEAQLQMAKDLMDRSVDSISALSWTGLPTHAQLLATCRLIWDHFVEKGSTVVRSADQLAFRIGRLRATPDPRRRILEELTPGRFAAESADIAVERVLDFDRTWAGYEFPRFLAAASKIQQSILPRRGIRAGEYTHFASLCESLFQPAFVAALDEYGVPSQIGARLVDAVGNPHTLDEALERFSRLDLSKVSLDPFELELVLDAQRGL